MNLHACGNFAEPLSTGGEEAAEQAAGFQLFEPRLPALGGAADSLEDGRQLGGDHGLAVAEETAGKIDQEKVAA